MKDPCNVEAVMGRLTAVLEAGGIQVAPNTLDGAAIEAHTEYHKMAAEAARERFDDAPPNETDNHTVDTLGNKKNESWLKKILFDNRNPSGILGEEIAAPVVKFHREFLAQYGHVLKESRPVYNKGIKATFDTIDPSGLKPGQQGYFDDWKNNLLQGGELYPNRSGQTAVGKAVNNYIGNSLKSLPHVVQGHAIASFFKIASLYPETAVQGFIKALSKGLGAEVPELKQAGLYGKPMDGHKGIPILQDWQGLVHLLDTPIKNICYYAGEARGGADEGFKAVQRITFSNRLGDTPRQLWSSQGRSQISLQNFAVGSIKLYTSLWGDVATKTGKDKAAASASLFLFHALPFVSGGLVAQAYGKDFIYGGIATALPRTLTDFIGMINPEFHDKIEESKTGFSEMNQIRSLPSSVGLGLHMASQGWEHGVKAIQKASAAYHEGDTATGNLELGSAALTFLKFDDHLGIANDGIWSKVYEIHKKDTEGDLDKDAGEAMRDFFFPVVEEPK